MINYNIPNLEAYYKGTQIANAPAHTGRLPLSNQELTWSVPTAPLFAPESYTVPDNVMERIQYRHSETPLNKLFFSQGNIDTIQERIRSTVFQMVKAAIDRQSDTDLLLVMRSYYLQYAENDNSRIPEELELLNTRVVNFCANRIAVEVEAYRYYRKDILDFPAPIANPVDVKIYGTRTGELKSFF